MSRSLPLSLPPIRRLLVLMSLACVLPAASLAGWLIVEHYQRDRQALAVGAIATARAMAAALDDRVRGMQAEAPARGRARSGLNAQIDSEQLLDILLRQKLPTGWIATIFDADGRIVARSLDHARHVASSGNPALMERMRQVPEDAVDSLTVDNVPVVTAFSRVASAGWSVAVAIPRAALNAPVRRSLLTLLGGATLLLMVTAGVAWLLGSRIGGSVRRLTAASSLLAQGQHFVAPPASFREAAELGQAFEAVGGEIRRTQQALRDKADRLDAIVDTAMDSIISVGDDGRILLFNHAAVELFRMPREHALGLPLENLIPHTSRAGHAEQMRSFAGEERPARMMAAGRVVHGLRADGQEFPAEASISTAMEGGQRLFTVILRDVTERERHMAALTRSNLELQRFAFVASHDLRSPLRSIMGFLDLLKMRHGEALGAKAGELVDRARHACRQMDGLTADLLSYARLDAQARPMEQVDTQALLADTLQMLDATVRETGADVSWETLPKVHGDRVQLAQLFQNLLGNAMKYCRGRNPRVHVHAERGEGEWVFHVADNGIGIEPQHLERVFEIFKRLHTQQEFSGSGIGLAVCRRVVERHGGRIWCTSSPGEGSTFSFSIADARSTS